MVIDTPGMRELGLWGEGSGLGETFEDIRELAGGCRFRDCQHLNEPGCAVQAALASGELPIKRYESYLKLRKEYRHLERKQSYAAAQEERRKWKGIAKARRKRRKEEKRNDE
jgi:ribosome biogenesis GTPase